MIYLKEAFEVNNSIKQINFDGNRLGTEETNMVHLKKLLQINISIQHLNLNGIVLVLMEEHVLSQRSIRN